MASVAQPELHQAENETKPSPLLELAAELRNEIYELAFTDDYDDDEVDLITARAPSKALLLSCRQVYNEARQIYKDKYREFWSTNDFVMDMVTRYRSRLRITARARDINRISRLQLVYPRTTYTLLDKRGGWLAEETNGTSAHVWFSPDATSPWDGLFDLTEDEVEAWCNQVTNEAPLHQMLRAMFELEVIGTDA